MTEGESSQPSCGLNRTDSVTESRSMGVRFQSGTLKRGQRAEALGLAASESQAHGFQYICTLNSDYVPRNEFSSGFWIEDYIRLR